MHLINLRSVDSQAQRTQANRAELVERLTRYLPTDGRVEPYPGIRLHRSSSPTDSLPVVADPAFCVIAQGSKEVYLGEECYRYDPYHYCLGTVDLPVVSRVVDASPERPYLSLRLTLDPVLVSSVLAEAANGISRRPAKVRAFDVSTLDPDLLDAVVRLARLLDDPSEATFLAPLVIREILYRLLMGNQGDRLRHIAVLGGTASPIARAIERLRQDFDRPLRIENLARELGMSVSSFHHHFKAVTGMTPLQFQKQLRLQEARRLMLGENLDATSAGYSVGYNDPSHFSREYKRLFGQPPMRDVERLRAMAEEVVTPEL
ncbi:AraC family transcriptional regulator [Litorilinea aerophila]|nr:AraC family transcriptional regulator [Litorilinea aerophila]